jgi:hypothetical protein
VAAAESSGEIVREKEAAGAPASSSYQTLISVQKSTIFQMILTSVESRIETISRICPFSLNEYVPGLRGNWTSIGLETAFSMSQDSDQSPGSSKSHETPDSAAVPISSLIQEAPPKQGVLGERPLLKPFKHEAFEGEPHATAYSCAMSVVADHRERGTSRSPSVQYSWRTHAVVPPETARVQELLQLATHRCNPLLYLGSEGVTTFAAFAIRFCPMVLLDPVPSLFGGNLLTMIAMVWPLQYSLPIMLSFMSTPAVLTPEWLGTWNTLLSFSIQTINVHLADFLLTNMPRGGNLFIDPQSAHIKGELRRVFIRHGLLKPQ